MSDLQKAAEDPLRRSGYLDKFIHGFGHFVGDGKWRLLTADFLRKLEDVEAWVARARR
jgi:Xaa-Pro aminopeptidase